MVKPTGHSWVVLPCSRGAGAGCARRGAGPPGTPVSPNLPTHYLAGGARGTGEDTVCLAIDGPRFRGFAPCHCLRAVTTEQTMLLVTRWLTHVLTGGSAVGARRFSWQGAGERHLVRCHPTGMSSSPKSRPRLAPQNHHQGARGEALGRKKEAKHLGNNPSVLQSQGHSLGLALLELHRPGTACASSPWWAVGWGRAGRHGRAPGKGPS